MCIVYIPGKYLPVMQGASAYPGLLRIWVDESDVIVSPKSFGDVPVIDHGDHLSIHLERFVPDDYAAYRATVAELHAAYAAWVSAQRGQY